MQQHLRLAVLVLLCGCGLGVGGRLFWRLYLGRAHGRASDELEPADRLVGGTTAVIRLAR